MGYVYLLHFSRPYEHARHYLGYTSRDITARLDEHAQGRGARLLEIVTAAGIRWTLARKWVGNRQLERKLKNQKNNPRLCPICRAERKKS